MSTTILVTDTYLTESLEKLRHALNPCEIVRTDRRPSAAELARADGLLIRSRTVVDAELLAQAPKLKVVVSATSGYDHVDAELCAQKNIAALYTPDANAPAAAELTLLLMLSCLRRQTEAQRALRNREWKDALKFGAELSDKTVGIIGLGRVGSRVARLTQCFGATVVAHDPYQTDDVFRSFNLERFGFSEVLAQADILSLHVPLNDETRHFINQRTLEQAKDGVILINTSRGSVVDERALIASLDSGEVSAAGLDVFETEPLAAESRLRKFSNVVITPHMGAFTNEAMARASDLAVNALIAALVSGERSNPIPIES